MARPQMEGNRASDKAKKRSASDFELDNQDQLGSTLDHKRVRNEYNYKDERQFDHSRSGPSRSRVETSQPWAPRSLEDFPPADEPLPADLSLHRLSRDFPNHLVGESLRRFIVGNWRARAVYNNMHPVAREALTKVGGWEVIHNRFEEEKRRMAEETGSESQAALHESPCTQSESEKASHPIQPMTEKTVLELDDLIRQELRKQRDVICGPRGSLSSAESDQRMMDVWGRRAQKWEHTSLATSNLGEEGLPTAKSSLREMLKRQNAIFRKAIQRKYPPQEDQGHHYYMETVARNARYFHLQTLRQWSAEWQQRLSAGRSQSQNPGDMHVAGLVSGLGGTIENPRNMSHTPKDPGDVQQGRISHALCPGQSNRSSTSRMPQEQIHQHPRPQIRPARNPSQQHNGLGVQRQHCSSAPQPQSQSHQRGSDVGNTYMAQPRTQQNGTSHGIIQSADLPPVSGYINNVSGMGAVPGGISLNPVMGISMPHSSAIQAQPSIKTSSQQIVAPSSQTQSGPRKRGAPRKRMFIQAPWVDNPLPASALTDEDEILDRFPEHLSKTDVMKRFVRSSSTRPGGYQTNDMVTRLLQHVNSRDFHGITQDQRVANIRRWVVKEKDACNKRLKSGRGSHSEPSFSMNTNAAARTTAQVPLNVSAMAASTPSMMAPMNSHTSTYLPPSSDVGPVTTTAPIEPMDGSNMSEIPGPSSADHLHNGMAEGPESNTFAWPPTQFDELQYDPALDELLKNTTWD